LATLSSNEKSSVFVLRSYLFFGFLATKAGVISLRIFSKMKRLISVLGFLFAAVAVGSILLIFSAELVSRKVKDSEVAIGEDPAVVIESLNSETTKFKQEITSLSVVPKNIYQFESARNEAILLPLKVEDEFFDAETKQLLLSLSEKARNKPLRVICTLVLNEEKTLREWILFNLQNGWNKIHIYDDGSVDKTQQIIESFNFTGMVVYELQRTPPGLWTIGNILRLFPQCARQYWNQSQVISCTDVDEFVFPGRNSWAAEDPMEDAFRRMGYLAEPGIAALAYLDCLHYGFNNYTVEPQFVIGNYPKRMAHLEPERKEFKKFKKEFASKEFCDCLPDKCELGPHMKKMYFPNGQKEALRPGLHTIQRGGTYRKVYPTADRDNGITCNHYQFKSYQHILEKGRKNRNGLMVKCTFPINHPFNKIQSFIEDPVLNEYARNRTMIIS